MPSKATAAGVQDLGLVHFFANLYINGPKGYTLLLGRGYKVTLRVAVSEVMQQFTTHWPQK